MPSYDLENYICLIRPLPDTVDRDIYDIPFIEKDPIDISHINNSQWLINMKNLTSNDIHASDKIVHSFNYDKVLLREYNRPIKYLQKTAGYYAVTSFDFSMDCKMDRHNIIHAVYMNRWSGAFLQSYGRRTAPTVGWLTPQTYDICLAGLRDESLFVISTLGVHNEEAESIFINGYHEMRTRYPLSQILCVGDRVDGMDDDVCFVKYEQSFGNWEKYPGFWQPSLIEWNGALAQIGGSKTCLQEAQ